MTCLKRRVVEVIPVGDEERNVGHRWWTRMDDEHTCEGMGEVIYPIHEFFKGHLSQNIMCRPSHVSSGVYTLRPVVQPVVQLVATCERHIKLQVYCFVYFSQLI